MRASQASLQALVRLQEQTADVHRRFLESQERTIQAIASQQGFLPGGHEVVALPIEPVVELVTELVATESVAPPVEPAPAPTPETVTRRVPATTGIAAALLSVVSEKTGYPEEMLELSMGLDADLGIDSIKRVEILSALHERLPNAPVITPEHLGEIETLGQIVEFLGGSESESTNGSPAPDVAASTAAVVEGDDGGASNGTANSTGDTARISAVLLNVVADKTGYPVDMLDVSMNLDADLGIDSIKRVEILAALQEALPDAPVVAPDQLGELRTLSQIVDVLAQGPDAEQTATATSPETAAQPATRPVPEQTATSAPVGVERLIPTLRPLVGIGDPIGLPVGSKIWVTTSGDVLSGQIVEELSAQGYSAEEVELADQGDTPPDDVAGLIVVVPPQVTDEDILLGFSRVRAMAPVLRRAALQGGALLCSVTCLGGGFALEAAPPEDADPTGGAWGGMTKTAAAEWSEVACKCIDVDLNRIDLASDIVNYALADGPVEIGLGTGEPVTVYLKPRPVEPATHAVLGSDDVVLITGGARGVTAEVAIAMAEAGQPRLILMGRSPDPTGEPDWLIGLNSEGDIKRAIVTHAGPGVSPQEVQAEFDSIHVSREILRNLARISAAGSEVVYTSVDVRDPDAVSASLTPLVKELGPITGLVHGAGVLADRNIEDKSDEDFASVYHTKVGGLRSVLTALAEAPLKVMVMFSSSTARFGRRGQVDYAAANEVLNKVAQVEADRRDGCRVVSVNWGPWDGGMVTPALKGMFSEEGIEVIGLESGAAYLLDEIACDGPAEVLVLGSGSQVPTMDPAPAVSTNGTVPDELPTVFERTIRTDTHEFMASHVLDGRAVLPAAMTLEWLAHGALHGNPGLRFVGVDDFRVFKGVLVQAEESFQVRVCADTARQRDEEFVVTAELCSGGSNGRRVLHARAEIVLAARQPDAVAPHEPESLPALDQSIESIYSNTLFHGPAMRGLMDVESCGDSGLVARCRVAPPPRDWMQEPVRNRWIADPLVLDSGLQAMIVWTSNRVGEASLPSRLTRYRQFVPAFPEDGARIVINVRDRTDARVVSDIDWVGEDGRVLARLEGYESVVDSSLSKAFRQNSLDKSASTKA